VTEERPIQVWIDDRSRIFRLGLCACLDGTRFGVAGESAAFNPSPDMTRTDVLVFELERVGLAAAVAAARPIDAHPTGARLVAITAAVEDDLIVEAVESGVTGILLRADATPQALLQCLRSVTAGNGSFPTSVLGQLLSSPRSPAGTGPAGALTGRELNVLQLLSRGDNTRQIAESLCYSEKTVKNIVHDVLVRMGCKNRAQAVAVATRKGLI
jgi:DNA-binding NarL/FixJ family response regulator